MFKPSNLTRNYSIASLVGIVLVAATLVYFYQAMAVKALMAHESQANSDLARTLGNTIWPKYSNFFWHARDMSRQELRSVSAIKDIHADILRKVQGLRVVKVKIFDANGLVAFSTEEGEIGDSEAENPSYIAAREGGDASVIVYKDSFNSYEGRIFDRNLVSSYVPIRRAPGQPVEGVFEIYSDVTHLLADIENTGSKILMVITALMLLLYLFLMLIVRRAQAVIEEHERIQHREQQQLIDYLDSHDEVTGLLNRKGLMRQMQHCLTVESHEHTGVAVIAIKLLNLSALSAGLGHKRVLKLLRQAADRIRGCASGTENLSHLDSNEFVLIIKNLISESELDFLAEKLWQMFTDPVEIDDNSVTLTVAVGADCSWGERPCEEVLKGSLLALDECELQHRHYLRYEAYMELKRLESLNLEMEISEALRRKEFVLYYQPKVDLASGEVTGMEALVRWLHPTRGLVMPGSFVELLEERDHIVELGEWLLHEACGQCRVWHDEGYEGLRVAVNVSTKQLQSSDFVQIVSAALQQSGLPPHALELELTESIMAEDTEEMLEVLQRLKELGLRFTIDDFGTGYSSLSYLMHFPFDHIKIDRGFTRDMMHNRDHATLTNAIITMAKSLNLGVVAEGVETQEQLEKVRQMGCDEVQGFYFSQAVEPDSFIEVVRSINREAAGELSS